MSINLRCRKLFVTENVFQHAYIHIAGLIHQSGSCVAQLVSGIIPVSEPCLVKMLFNKMLNGFDGNAFSEARKKQRVFSP